MQQYLQPSRATTPPLYLGSNQQQVSNAAAGQQPQHRLLPTPALRGLSQPLPQQGAVPSRNDHGAAAQHITTPPLPSTGAPSTVPLRIPDFETAYRSRPSSPLTMHQAQPQQQYPSMPNNNGIPPGTGGLHAPLWTTGSAPSQVSYPPQRSYSCQPEVPMKYEAHARQSAVRQDSVTMHQAQPPSSYYEHPHAPHGHQAALDAMTHFQSRMEQERAHVHKLDQEEANMAAEEATLRMRLMELDGERRASEESHHAIHAGWSEIFASEEWFHATPFLDLNAEAAAVQFRCHALTQHLEALSHTLQGHEMELKRYDGNDAVRNRQLASMQMLEECCAKMERRRQSLRATCERHFDAETQRERAARRHAAEVDSSIDRLQQMTGNRRDPAASSRKEPTVGQKASSVTGSSTAQQQQQQQRQRLVSFRSASQTDDRPLALQTALTTAGPYAAGYNSGEASSGIDGGGSFCIGLDEDSTAGDMFGINDNSIAFSLCDTKRHRSEAISAM